MNKLEFNEVLKALKINNPLTTTTGRYGTREDVHYWNDLAIYFGGSYYTVIKGKIPLEVANRIYEKYSNNEHQIRVDGGCINWKPSDYAQDDIYKAEIKKYIEEEHDMDSHLEKCRKSKKNLKRRKDSNKYLTTYHIDTKEGLTIFLTEMQDYLARKNGLPENSVRNYENLMVQIQSEILKKANTHITTNTWMLESKESEKFFNAIEKERQTAFGRLLRDALDRFDKTVNPYPNYEVKLDDLSSYMQKVKIDANIYDQKDGEYRQNCCDFHIIDKETGNKASTFRTPNGFAYQLHYTLGEDKYLIVSHYYTTTGNDETDLGEVIYI